MKRLLLLLTCYLMFSFSVMAGSGETGSGKETNGGDSYTLNFMNIARTTLDYFQNGEGVAHLQNRVKQLQEMFNKTMVVSYYRVCWVEDENRVFEIDRNEQCVQQGGIERDAVNLRDDANNEYKIFLSRKKWTAMEDDLLAKVRLVIHEYMGLTGVADELGQETSRFMNFIDENLQSFRKWFGSRFSFEGATNYLCVVEGIINGENHKLIYENIGLSPKESDFAFFKKNGVLRLRKDDEGTARLRGKSTTSLQYQVVRQPHKLINDEQVFIKWSNIDFNEQGLARFYIKELSAVLSCYRIK